MTIAEKLTAIAENEQKIYEKGKADEQKKFWQIYQNYGSRNTYQYAFYDIYWNDTSYNPIHEIKSISGNYIFQSARITDTKVTVDLSGCTSSTIYNTFNNCINLKTIRKFIVNENIGYNAVFTNCNKLENIVIEGVIGKSFNIGQSPLSKVSITNIFEHLSETATEKTLTLKKTAVNETFGIDVDDSTTFPEGSEYYNLRHSRDNWSVSYA